MVYLVPQVFILYLLLSKSFCILYLVCDKMLRLTFTYPSWLPGFLCYCVFCVVLVGVRHTNHTTSLFTPH